MSAVKEVVIGETTFYLQKIPPFPALKLFGDLQRDLLPAAASLMSVSGGMGDAEPAEETEVHADGSTSAAPVFPVSAVPASEKSEAQLRAEEEKFLAAIQKTSMALDGDAFMRWANKLLTPEFVAVSVEGAAPVRLSSAKREEAFAEFTDIVELMAHSILFNFGGPIRTFLTRFGRGLPGSKTVEMLGRFGRT